MAVDEKVNSAEDLNFRCASLEEVDPEIFGIIQQETNRLETGIEMIPSENFVSEAVLEANGSILTNKYAEGYPGRRYYGGWEFVDEIERVTRRRAKELFNMEHASVQPHSGAGANQVVFEAIVEPGDTVMGMRLDMGGHLTHGSPVNFSGKHYNVVAYGVDPETHLIDEQEIRDLALEHKPKMIICGATAYSRHIDFEMFRRVADEVGAVVLADISHYAGLVVAGEYPSPAGHAQIVTTTTHKTLRGPRSAIVLSDKDYGKAIDKAVFPGLQGGPHMHTISAKAVALKEASAPAFKDYAKAVIANARALASELQAHGLDIISGGTDSHVMLVDLRKAEVTGKVAEAVLGKVGITCNKNTIPFDPEKPFVGSGIRMGTPALTTRGFGEEEMKVIARITKDAIENREDEAKLASLREETVELCSMFPMYRHRLVR